MRSRQPTGASPGSGERIGTSWGTFISVVSAGGDFSGSRKAGLLAINDAGSLILYRGNSGGGFAAGDRAVGQGWTVYR